jgi:hypothetical protein
VAKSYVPHLSSRCSRPFQWSLFRIDSLPQRPITFALLNTSPLAPSRALAGPRALQSIPQPQRRPHQYLPTPSLLLIRRQKIFHPARHPSFLRGVLVHWTLSPSPNILRQNLSFKKNATELTDSSRCLPSPVYPRDTSRTPAHPDNSSRRSRTGSGCRCRSCSNSDCSRTGPRK